jgi:hypothetical protein
VYTNYQATFFERVVYVPSGPFAIFAPTGASVGDQFAIKNASEFSTAITVNGNTSFIEPPYGGYTLVPTFAIGGVANVVWEFDGTNWGIV